MLGDFSEPDDGGYLVPDEYVHGGYITYPVVRKDWRRIFWYVSIVPFRFSYFFHGIARRLESMGKTTERKYTKGFMAYFREVGLLDEEE